jgi:hypothetical protein
MSSGPAAPDDLFASMAEEFRDVPGVTQPSDATRPKTAFGSSALKINNKIFAMLTSDKLVVKLPRQRVDGLIAAGEGERFDPGHGRLMREWVAVAATSRDRWVALAREAMDFVASKP